MSVFGGTPRQLILNIDSAVSFAPDGNRFTYLRWLPDQKDNSPQIHIADKDGGNDQVLYTTADGGPGAGVVSGWKENRLATDRSRDDEDGTEGDGASLEETHDGGRRQQEFPG